MTDQPKTLSLPSFTFYIKSGASEIETKDILSEITRKTKTFFQEADESLSKDILDSAIDIFSFPTSPELYRLAINLPSDWWSKKENSAIPFEKTNQYLESMEEKGDIGAKAPDYISSTPLINPAGGTNPNGIPTGGPYGKPNVLTEKEMEKYEFKMDKDALGKKMKPYTKRTVVKPVYVFLVDTLPMWKGDYYKLKDWNRGLQKFDKALSKGEIRMIGIPDLGTQTCTKTGDIISSHGLFSAYQIHQLAPEASVTLVEGLDNTGNGNFGWFRAAMRYIKTEAKKIDKDCTIILNLSLCFPTTSTSLCGTVSVASTKVAFDLGGSLADFVGAGLDDSLPHTNIAVLEAAGNTTSLGHPPTELAGSLDDILEVVAGRMQASTFVLDSYSHAETQATEVIKSYGGPMSGLFIDPEYYVGGKKQSNTSYYAKWSGTSFATAIASGTLAYLCTQGYSLMDAITCVRQYPQLLQSK